MKQKILPLLALLLIAAMVLAACGGSAAPTEEPAPAPAEEESAPADEEMAEEEMAEDEMAEEMMEEMEPVTITMWHSFKDSNIEAITNTIIPAFNEEHPNITVELLFVPDDELRGKYETAAATGGGPEILRGSADWGSGMYDALLVQDVSDVAAAYEGVIPEAAFAQGQYSGVLTGVPYDLKGVVMYRNTSIMPEPASDIDDLIAKHNEVSTDDVFGFIGETGSFFAMGHLHAVGGLMTAEGDPVLASAEGEAWAEMLAKFAQAGPVSNNDDNDVNLFKTGNAGVIIDGAWNIGAFTDLGDVVVIDPWPAGMSGFVQSSFLFLNANAADHQAEAAKEFMSFLLSTEAQAAFYNADPSFIPANTEVEVDDPLRLQAMQAFSGGVGFITIPEMNAYWTPVNDAILAIVNDGADIPSTLSTAQETTQAAVDEIRAGQ